MFLPRGALYYFKSTGDTNLVLLSSYAYAPGQQGDGRLGADGMPLPENRRCNVGIFQKGNANKIERKLRSSEGGKQDSGNEVLDSSRQRIDGVVEAILVIAMSSVLTK